MTSETTNGAGPTRVISCATAEVISDPADWMLGCMRGASDSMLNGVFDERRDEGISSEDLLNLVDRGLYNASKGPHLG